MDRQQMAVQSQQTAWNVCNSNMELNVRPDLRLRKEKKNKIKKIKKKNIRNEYRQRMAKNVFEQPITHR